MGVATPVVLLPVAATPVVRLKFLEPSVKVARACLLRSVSLERNVIGYVICQAGTVTAFARAARSAVRAKASLGFRAGSAGCAVADVQLRTER